MAKSLSVMQTNIGNNIQDTSTSMKALIAVWLNNKYEDIWNRCRWNDITDFDYTFDTTANIAYVDLPAAFGEEIFVADIANGHSLTRKRIGERWRDRTGGYQADATTAGNPLEYTILKEVITSTGLPYGQIWFDPKPDTAETYAMPYKRKFVKLLGTSDTCTTDTASTIIASAATFIADGVEVGMRVNNTTDHTYGYVASVDSETQLTMDTDVCPDGDESIMVSNYPLITGIEQILELGATGEAWAYKRQFQKADYYLNRYEIEVLRKVGQEKTKVNQLSQFLGPIFTEGGRPIWGNQSYDSI